MNITPILAGVAAAVAIAACGTAGSRPAAVAYRSATKTPQLRTTISRPSSASTLTALAAVVAETRYSAASCLALGICSPGRHSPSSSRSRSAAASAS